MSLVFTWKETFVPEPRKFPCEIPAVKTIFSELEKPSPAEILPSGRSSTSIPIST